MAAPTVASMRSYFSDQPTGRLWIPTKTRNLIIEDEGFSASPKTTSQGKVYNFNFKSIGGGMWEVSLFNLDGSLVQ
jgi:hypothetical protein